MNTVLLVRVRSVSTNYNTEYTVRYVECTHRSTVHHLTTRALCTT